MSALFDNKFNSDGTIHFEVEDWICTDPDTFQFCRFINGTTFEYIQLKDPERVKDSLCIGKQALSYLNDSTTARDWYQDIVNVDDYDADEIGEYLSPYGGILDGTSDERIRNQITAECIFETDIVNSGFYDYD